MTPLVKVSGLSRLRNRMLAIVGEHGADLLHKAAQKSANEFEANVRRAIPPGPDNKDGHLVDSLQQYPAGPIGVAVSIGGPDKPYPLHLEVGHKARDGSWVPGKSAWYPAYQLTKKKAAGRFARAQRQAIKDALAVKNGGEAGGKSAGSA